MAGALVNPTLPSIRGATSAAGLAPLLGPSLPTDPQMRLPPQGLDGPAGSVA